MFLFFMSHRFAEGELQSYRIEGSPKENYKVFGCKIRNCRDNSCVVLRTKITVKS